MKKNRKIRVVTYHRAINNGAVLQAFSLLTALKKKFPSDDVKILDYQPLNFSFYEILKFLKMYRKDPFFNVKRFFVFQKSIKKTMDLDSPSFFSSLASYINQKKINLLVVGSDCVWRLSKNPLHPKFPSIYWPEKNIHSKKISYAASAYNADKALWLENSKKIKEIIDDFLLLSVRDEHTKRLLQQSNVKKNITKIPDPTFMYEIFPTTAKAKMEKAGVDFKRPVFGVLAHGSNPKVKEITEVFRKKDFQIVALSMYNPYADIQLGDILSPFEWAEAFRYMSFCITDRFHGTVFCLKNFTPFCAIEIEGVANSESKKFQVLSDFEMEYCHADLDAEDYSIEYFEKKAVHIMEKWKQDYCPKIENGIQKMKDMSDKFLSEMKKKFDE